MTTTQERKTPGTQGLDFLMSLTFQTGQFPGLHKSRSRSNTQDHPKGRGKNIITSRVTIASVRDNDNTKAPKTEQQDTQQEPTTPEARGSDFSVFDLQQWSVTKTTKPIIETAPPKRMRKKRRCRAHSQEGRQEQPPLFFFEKKKSYLEGRENSATEEGNHHTKKRIGT